MEERRKRVQEYGLRFQKAQKAVVNKHKLWATLDMFDRGEQWKNLSLPPWIPKPVTNWIRYIRTLKRANLASAISTAHFTARDPQYREDVQRLQRAYTHVWQTKKVPRVIRRCIDRAVLQGTAIAVVYTDDKVGGTYYGENDPRNKLYRGDICVKRFPNANVFPDPDAFHIDECKYIIFTENTTLNAVKRNKKFQEYAGKALEELTTEMLTGNSDEDGQIYDRENGPGRSGMNIEGDEMVTVHAIWERYINDKGRWQACEADFQRFYGLNPSELDANRLAALYRGLPPDSSSHTPDGAWPVSVELLAQIAEILHALYRSHLSANGVKERDLPKPLRVPRPGSAAGARPKASTPDDVRAAIERAWGGPHA